MAKSLSPLKFYGGSLPRPRLYTDVKFNEERVDPPPSVTDPLLSWAREAHWSMGGMRFTRCRLQGRIEGSIKKLRSQEEERAAVVKKRKKKKKSGADVDEDEEIRAETPVCSRRIYSESPPPAPYAIKRRRFIATQDDRRLDLIKNLKEEFDSVADIGVFLPDPVARRTRSRCLKN